MPDDAALPDEDPPEWLDNAAAHYLARYPASRAHFRDVLRRKIARRSKRESLSPPTEAWIAALVAKYAGLGLLDDGRYAQERARSLLQRGKPARAIRAALREKGVGAEDIEAAIAALSDSAERRELYALLTYARRRRLGPYRTRPAGDQGRQTDRDRKDLAALARAGFSYELARRLMAATDPEDLAELEEEGRIEDLW